MNEDILVIEITKEDNKLKMSAFEKSKSTDHRHYSEITISTNEIDNLCDDINKILNTANRSGKLHDDALNELKKVAHLLYDSLFTIEIKNSLKATTAKYLILSIDEKLVQIPWELLFDGEKYLCLRFALGRSVRTRQRFQEVHYRNVVSPAKVLILSDPTGDLKSAYEEGVAICNAFDKRKDKIKADLKTTEIDLRYVKKNIRDYDIVHFAGHANYNSDEPSKSGWILQDGIFSSEDIISLGSTAPLPSIIFSNACQSGQTEEWKITKGFENEVYGLANAFLLAGVKHYIGTFWKIIDESCLLFAKEFYKNVINGNSTGEALRLSRIKLIERYGESSIIWASYMLYGDPASFVFSPPTENRLLTHTSHSRKIFIGIAAIIVALVGAGIFTSRLVIKKPISVVKKAEVQENTIAVLPFENLNKDSNDIGSGIAEVIITKLSSLKQIKIVDSTVISRIWTDAQTFKGIEDKNVLNLIGAKTIILGSYQKMDDKIRIIAKLVDASSGQVADTTEVFGSYQDIFVLQDAIAFNILAKLNVKISTTEKNIISESQPTRNITAFEYYAKASEAYLKADYQTAESLLKKAVELDSEYQQAIFGLGQVYEITNRLDLAKKYYEKNKTIAEKKNDKNALVLAYFNYGRIIGRTGDFEKALEYEQKALEIAREINSKQLYATILSYMSLVYVGLDQDTKALEIALESKKIFEESNNVAALGDVYFNTATIYGFSKTLDKEKAKEYFDKAINTYQSLNYNDGVFRAAFGLGTLPSFADRHPNEAVQYLNRAMNIAKDVKNSIYEGMSYKALADLYRNIGDYGNAKQFYDKALVTTKDNNPRLHLDAMYNFAWLHLIQLEYEKAIEYLNQSASEAEMIGDLNLLASAKSNIASAYISMGRYDEASIILQDQLKQKDKISDYTLQGIYLNIAKVNFKMGNPSKGEKVLLEAQPLFNKRPLEAQPYIYTTIASFYEEQNNYEKAIFYYNQTIKLYQQVEIANLGSLAKHGLFQAYNGIAKCYNATKNYEKAKEYYEKALSIGIEINSPSINSVKTDLYSLGARKEVEKKEILNPNALQLHEKANRIFYLNGNREEAIKLLTEANRLEPHNITILSLLALVCESDGKLDEAIRYHNECLRLLNLETEKSEIARQYMWIGFIYYMKGDLQEAVKYCEKALSLAIESKNDDTLAMVYADTSRIYEGLNQDEKAMEFAEKGIAISEKVKANYPNSYQTLALVYSKKKDIKKAIEHGERYLKKAQESGAWDLGSAYSLLGNLYIDTDIIKAIGYLNKAAEELKQHNELGDLGSTYYWLGYCYERNLQNDKAIEYYLKSIELSEKTDNFWILSCVYSSIARVYFYKDELSQAQIYQDKFIEFLKINHKEDEIGLFYCVLGNLYSIKYPEKAKEYHEASIRILENIKGEKYVPTLIFNYIALSYRSQLKNELDNEINYSKKGLAIAAEHGLNKEALVFTQALAISYHKKSEYEAALDWYKKALSLAKELNDKQVIDEVSREIDRLSAYLNKNEAHEATNIGDNLNQKSILYVIQGKYKLALENCYKALEIFKKSNNKEKIAGTLGEIAAIYLTQNDLINADRNIKESMKILDEINNKEYLGIMHGAQGILLEKKSDYEGAEKEYNIAISLVRGCAGEYRYQAAFYTCLGAINFKKGNYSKAVDNYKKAQDINEIKEDQNIVCLNRLLNGYAYFKDKKYPNAIDSIKKSLDIAEKIDDKINVIIGCILIGKADLLINNLDEAEQYFNKAIEQADLLDDSRLKIVSWGNIALFYKAKGDGNAYNKYIDLLKQDNGSSHVLGNEIDASKIDNLLDEIIEERDYFTRLWL